MRYITLPEPVELPIVANTETGELVKYSLERLLYENVWPHPFWRESVATQDAFFRIYDKFAEAFKTSAKVVAIEDADFEMLLPLGTQRGVKLAENLVYPLQKLMRCFFAAGSKAPEQLQ